MTDGLSGVFKDAQAFLSFLFFIAPGFISLRAYEARRSGDRQKVNDYFVDVVMYSFATDLFWIPIVRQISFEATGWMRTSLLALSAIGVTLSAFALGWGWYSLQSRLASAGVVVDPIAKPWDKFFGGVGQRRPPGIALTLHDGTKIGGLYAGGFASSYPAEEQLHIGETWLIDQDSGAFEARIEGTLGFIIDKKDVLTVELFDWETVRRREGNHE